MKMICFFSGIIVKKRFNKKDIGEKNKDKGYQITIHQHFR